MSNDISNDVIASFKSQLENHPIYDEVKSIEDLQCFMEHHVYSVWDFMSLIKYLQSFVAPTTYPWIPKGDPDVRRFINELVLEEESDLNFYKDENGNDTFCSHFELYHVAMGEIGADNSISKRFLQEVATKGINEALAGDNIPDPSKNFSLTTFGFIQGDKAHEVASALALGREHIIPCMFRSILEKIGVNDAQAPVFHYYLNRHIGLDEDFHAPLSLRLLNSLCEGDKQKIDEAIAAADVAVKARLSFWDRVMENIQKNRSN